MVDMGSFLVRTFGGIGSEYDKRKEKPMNDDLSGFAAGVVVALIMFLLGTCVGSDYSYTRMCTEDLLPLQETLADSLDLAQKYDECEWWEDEG